MEPEELEERYRGAKDPVLRGHYQIVRLIAMGKKTTEIMEATGYCRNWIQEVARRYNSGGPEALGDGGHENPGAKERAPLGEEARSRTRPRAHQSPFRWRDVEHSQGRRVDRGEEWKAGFQAEGLGVSEEPRTQPEGSAPTPQKRRRAFAGGF